MDLVSLNPIKEFEAKANNIVLTDLTDKCLRIRSIENDQQLIAAQTTIDNLKDFIKDLDAVKKSLKAPLMEIINQYDSAYKNKVEAINAVVNPATNLIIEYKAKQAEMLRAEQARLEKEKQAEQEKLDEVLERIDRIKTRFVIIIFGGYAQIQGKEVHSVNGIETYDACIKLKEKIEKDFPNSSDFHPFEDRLEALKKVILKHLSIRADRLKSLPVDELEDFFNQSREKGKQILNLHQTPVVQIKPTNNELSLVQAESQIKKATKGLRYTLKYQVISPAIVPRDLLGVSDDKMKMWIKTNGEQIKEELKNKPLSEQIDTQTIPGIKLYLSVTNVKS